MDIKKYIYGHCVQPVKVRVYDAYSQSYVYRLLPCGKCLHCRNTHINEWCTRLFAQRKYSQFCYYVSLDYAPFDITKPVAKKLAAETAACYHNINKYKHFGMHPLLLCKNHLQDFYKRLRKNTGLKIQYFACGEYGTHANGRGYGRPHFHNIVFSDYPISCEDFEKAWSIDGYRIGRVDYVDMNSIVYEDSNESLKIFKYVCKYLQKSDFDFDKLATIDYHRAYFKSLSLIIKQNNLFETEFITASNLETGFTWKDYTSLYSPFIVCSRRPAIGSAYLAEHLERFERADFRLFGLPLEGLAFPRYYLRKAKESVCPFLCVGRDSQIPSSSSRLENVIKILRFLQDSRLSIENWTQKPEFDWRICRTYVNQKLVPCICSKRSCPIPISDLHVYDSKNKYFYQFDGYAYKVWAKISGLYSLLYTLDICEALKEFVPNSFKYRRTYVIPFHVSRVSTERELDDYVNKIYGSFKAFNDDIYSHYQAELDSMYKRKKLMSNSKQTL